MWKCQSYKDVRATSEPNAWGRPDKRLLLRVLMRESNENESLIVIYGLKCGMKISSHGIKMSEWGNRCRKWSQHVVKKKPDCFKERERERESSNVNELCFKIGSNQLWNSQRCQSSQRSKWHREWWQLVWFKVPVWIWKVMRSGVEFWWWLWKNSSSSFSTYTMIRWDNEPNDSGRDDNWLS